jgi:hypothetical protein
MYISDIDCPNRLEHSEITVIHFEGFRFCVLTAHWPFHVLIMRFYQDDFKCGVHVDDVFCSGTFDNEHLGRVACECTATPNKGVKRLLGYFSPMMHRLMQIFNLSFRGSTEKLMYHIRNRD